MGQLSPRDALDAKANDVFAGTVVRKDLVATGHLFLPMPDVNRDDPAFIDRPHFYLPGWEMPNMRNEHFTDHYGLVVDYLTEAQRDLRKRNFTELIDHQFSFGSHLNTRDRKAGRKTVSGMMKLLHPHGEVSRDDLEGLLILALEGRRRAKEQLKQMGSFEYHQTAFRCAIDKTTHGIARELDTADIHVEVIALLGNRAEAEIGFAFFVAAYSALRTTAPQAGLLVLRDMSVLGTR